MNLHTIKSGFYCSKCEKPSITVKADGSKSFSIAHGTPRHKDGTQFCAAAKLMSVSLVIRAKEEDTDATK